MRQGIFEINIIRSNGTSYDEREVEGKVYIRAEAGCEYKIKVKVHRDGTSDNPMKYCIASICIDGIPLTYSLPLDLRGLCKSKFLETTFNGFLHPPSYVAFSFSPMKQSEGTLSVHDKSSVQLKIYEAEPSDGSLVPDRIVAPAAHDSGVGEAKKFWEQPSLKTIPGATLMQCGQIRNHYKCVNPRQPVATLEVFYHTSDMVDFLQEHQAQLTAQTRLLPPVPNLSYSAAAVSAGLGHSAGDDGDDEKGEDGEGGILSIQAAVPVKHEVIDLEQEEDRKEQCRSRKRVRASNSRGRGSSSKREIIDLTL